jgi:hypothetical protein
MPKTTSRSRLLVRNPGPHNTALNWNNGPDQEFPLYALAFHKAAKTLVANLELDRMAHSDWDACPVVFLYRHALELYLKAIVLGDGSNILESKPDPAMIYRTHSLLKLLPIVCDIVKAFGWEPNLTCTGVADVAALRSIVSELHALDPRSHAFRYPVNTEGEGSVRSHLTFSVLAFAKQMDAVLDLLDDTAWALEAEWGVRSEAAVLEAEWYGR